MPRTPFTHGNLKLAIALCAAECAPIEIRRIYTPQECHHFGLSAIELCKQGRGGKLEFDHEPTDRLQRACAAFDERTAEIKTARDAGAKEAPDVTGSTPEIAAQIAVDVLECVEILKADVRNPDNAWIQEGNGEGRFTPGDKFTDPSGKEHIFSGTVSHPGLRRAHAKASHATLKKLNLLPHA